MISTKKVPQPIEVKEIKKQSLAIFNLFSPIALEVEKLVSSPLRTDNRPSFILLGDDDEIRYYDFSTGDSGDCIDFAMGMTGKTFGDVLDMIKDGNIMLSENVITTNSKKRLKANLRIVKYKPWTTEDKNFWEKWPISLKTLQRFHVRPIALFEVNNRYIYCDKIAYVYQLGSRVKIYQPFNKELKFVGNSNHNTIQGYAQIDHSKDDLYIVASLKEVMLMYELGYTAIAPNSESSLFSKTLYRQVTANFKNIYILYDWDEAGIKLAQRFRDHYDDARAKIIKIQAEEKDLTDYSKEFGIAETDKLIKKCKTEII